jgi:hypothetical protein
LKSTFRPQTKANGVQGTVAFLDLRLRQHCQFLAVVFIFIFKVFFEKEVMKTKGIASITNH